MLDVQMLKAMPPGTVFATGVAIDEPGGLFMAKTGLKLRWVAVRGNVHDWTIYCHFANNNIAYIKHNGDKVFDEQHVRKLVPCDNEAYILYRK